MIAPLRDPDSDSTTVAERRELKRARRLAAAMLFANEPDQPPCPSVPKWQAWLLAGWAVIVAIAYIVYQALSLTPAS